MFKIGEFSRLTRVPITTLHHYDEIGLFRPMHSDPFSGYRYYGFEQLPRLNRILALRGLGFTLEQIGRMLGADDAIAIGADELRVMLKLRQAELEQQVEAAQERLAQVELRLAQIEQEGKMADVEVLLKDEAARTIVGARQLVPEASLMRERCIALDAAACKLIDAAHLKTDSISFALYYRSDAPGIDVEMAYTVAPPEEGGVAPAREAADASVAQVHPLPDATVAYAVYRGSYDDFGAVGQLHGAIARWIEANGYQVTGTCREYYLRPPQKADDRAALMEIQYPVERKG